MKKMLTIKEVVANYPYLKTTTVFTYIQRGLFRPVSYFPPPNGPGRSSLLNKADVVVLGILASLHNLGVRFGHLTPTGDEKIPDTAFIIENGHTSSLTLDDIGPGRRLQLELEATGFQNMIVVHKSLVVGFYKGQMLLGESCEKRDFGSLTEVYMLTDRHLGWHLDAIKARQPYDSISFINLKKITSIVNRIIE